MLRNAINLSMAALLCLALSHCGWHLRGATSPLPAMSLELLKQSPYELGLIRALEQQGVKFVNLQESPVHLTIHNISYSKKPVMLDNLGNVSKIRLQASVKFSLARQQQTLIEGKFISVFREYTFDETAVLAKEKEDNLNRQSLFEDLAIRTRSILNVNLQKNKTSTP